MSLCAYFFQVPALKEASYSMCWMQEILAKDMIAYLQLGFQLDLFSEHELLSVLWCALM